MSASRSSQSSCFENMTLAFLSLNFDPAELENLHKLCVKHGATLISWQNGPVSPTLHPLQDTFLPRADCLVSIVKSPTRIARNLPLSNISISVVSPDWITDSIKQGFPEPLQPYEIIIPQDARMARSRASTPLPSPHVSPKRKYPVNDGYNTSDSEEMRRVKQSNLIPSDFKRLMFECQRRHPLNHPNEKLCQLLEILAEWRTLQAQEKPALAYRRAQASLRSYPKQITSWMEAKQLPYIGPKITALIKEYLQTGTMEEVKEILARQDFKTLQEFSSLYSVGPTKAWQFYSKGHRSIGDIFTELDQKTEKGSSLTHAQSLGIRYHQVFSNTFPRSYASLIHRILRKTLDVILIEDAAERGLDIDKIEDQGQFYGRGILLQPVDEYRRGLPKVHNLDVLLLPSYSMPSLLTKILDKLQQWEMVEAVVSKTENPTTTLSIPVEEDDFKMTESDTLSKLFLLIRHPSVAKLPKDLDWIGQDWQDEFNATPMIKVEGDIGQSIYPLHIFLSDKSTYATSLVAYTGSELFIRSIHEWSKKQGFRFSPNGLYKDDEKIECLTERDVFEKLGLEFIPPEYRNA